MAININPDETQYACYAVKDRELVARCDGKALLFDDLKALQEALGGEIVAEADNGGLCVLGLDSMDPLPEGYQKQTIRGHFATDSEEEVWHLSRAKALTEWLKTTRYCGRCGSALHPHETLTAMTCPECGLLIFPRIEPCIITVVKRQDGKILLARHTQRNQQIYACIAGFMEAGETAEHAVAREVMEETGLKVKNIRYFGSQSWPFPSQLMLGFTAEYDGGEITLQEEELEDAQWFDPDHCPASPPPGSIAYRLIHES